MISAAASGGPRAIAGLSGCFGRWGWQNQQPGFRRRPTAARRFDGRLPLFVQDPLFEASVAQGLPRQLDRVEGASLAHSKDQIDGRWKPSGVAAALKRYWPKLARHWKRRDLQIGSPGKFVTIAMKFLMMFAAQRHSEFVADFAPERSGLRKFKMMGIARNALADQTGPARDERQMGLAASADALWIGNVVSFLAEAGSELGSFWTVSPHLLDC
jgi:hypothetical protein